LKNPYKKWREENVLFLDDGFDCDEAYECLTGAGFKVERFRNHFQREDGGREQSVPDPRVIQLCNRHGWLLVTTDSNIVNAHRKEIAECKRLGLVASAHNSVGNIMEWAVALVKLKPTMDKNNFKKRERPWHAQFGRDGKFTVGPRSVENR